VRLATFTHDGATRIGVVTGDQVVDLAAAAPGLPREMCALLAAGEPALAAAANAARAPRATLPLARVRLEAPVLHPAKFLAIGLNYLDHIEEAKLPKPEFPTFFNKQTSCVNGPYDPIHLPRASSRLDYEGELAFAIGRRCRHVPKERAHEVIAGYFVCNDVSVRDWQFKAQTMTLGKSWDTHGPIGPWLVTPDEVGDPHALSVRTWVNGELRQDYSTKHMVFDCYDMVATLSTVCTLEPGDLISAGTSSGAGALMNPRRYLVAGDVVRIEIEKIGWIENRVIDEPADTVRI
jgi:2-keto-4-pentenoate hydratase/2-oxohepta-3-ene-1,7-dioic acid hydratase in catechol pathway